MGLPSLSRKFFVGIATALTLVSSLGASVTTASADPYGRPSYQASGRPHVAPRHYGHRHVYRPAPRRHHWVGPAIVGGLALGALAARPYYGPRCWIEQQRSFDYWGRPVIRNVEVCR